MHQLILASASPRRKHLLEEAGFSFLTFPVKVSENLEKNLNVREQILAIAQRKARAAFKAHNPLSSQPFLILAADTMVVLEGKALGKPQNPSQAVGFLRALSGRSHEVTTAVVLIESSTEKEAFAIATTKVFFRSLSEEEIQKYVSTGEPMDKAGAYGIQGLGGKFVEKYEGPFDNVVGLPVDALKKILEQNNWVVSPPPGCRVVAVSKLQPIEKIQALYAQGQRVFAENYVQELLGKMAALSAFEIQWHFIGRLQRNKLKQLVGRVQLIHSVDSLGLVQEIEKVAALQNIKQRILLQVNLSQEPTKGGLSREELLPFLESCQKLSHVEVVGLMTMPPLLDPPELVRPYFRELRELQKKLLPRFPQLRELSMGTSHDYLIAVQEGATLIRLGTSLFGERSQKATLV